MHKHSVLGLFIAFAVLFAVFGPIRFGGRSGPQRLLGQLAYPFKRTVARD